MRKLNYFSVGSSITTNNHIMNALNATTKEKDSLRLTLSPNLSLSVLTTSDTTVDTDPKIRIVKDEVKQVGSHKILRKGVIQLTANEYTRLKASLNSIDSFINFVNQNAQQTNSRSDEGP